MQSIMGDSSESLVGFIGTLVMPKFKCADVPKDARATKKEMKDGDESTYQLWLKDRCEANNIVAKNLDAMSNEYITAIDPASGAARCACVSRCACECCAIPVHRDAFGNKIDRSLTVKISGAPGSKADREISVLMSDL